MESGGIINGVCAVYRRHLFRDTMRLRHYATNISFAKAKIIVDITLIVIAVVCGYFYFGTWQCQVVDTETLMSMIIVGVMMKLFDQQLDWFSQ